MRQNRLGLAVILAIAAGFFFATMGASVKVVTRTVPPPVALWARQLFSLIVICPWLGIWSYREGPKVFLTHRFGAHIARSAFSLAVGLCTFFSLSMIPLSDAITLNWTRPLFLPIVVWVWLRKRVEGAVWLGLLIGFIGVAFILKPGIHRLALGEIIALCGGFLGAIALLLIRRLAKTEPPVRIMAYYFAMTAAALSIAAAVDWVSLTLTNWLALAGIGCLGVLYQFCLTTAYRHGRATLISSVLYSGVVFTLLWDYIIWRRLPDWWSIGGIALVICGAIIALIFSHSRAAPGEQPVNPPS